MAHNKHKHKPRTESKVGRQLPPPHCWASARLAISCSLEGVQQPSTGTQYRHPSCLAVLKVFYAAVPRGMSLTANCVRMALRMLQPATFSAA